VILSKLKEVIDISVPWFYVYSESTLSFAATLIHISSSIIKDLKHRHKSVGITICASDIAISSSDV
jgi:hypothetical protein